LLQIPVIIPRITSFLISQKEIFQSIRTQAKALPQKIIKLLLFNYFLQSLALTFLAEYRRKSHTFLGKFWNIVATLCPANLLGKICS
jgi:hypothetical protein